MKRHITLARERIDRLGLEPAALELDVAPQTLAKYVAHLPLSSAIEFMLNAKLGEDCGRCPPCGARAALRAAKETT